MDNNGRTKIDDTTVSVYSPHDGGYYAEQTRRLKDGRIQFRVTKQVWPSHADVTHWIKHGGVKWGKYL